MINVANKRCEGIQCTKYPCFNYPGESMGRFCVDHKLSTMINVRRKKCSNDQCDKEASFNYLGKLKGEFCADHKQDGMVNIRNRKCAYPNCIKAPYFGFRGKKGKFCNDHKEPEMINVKSMRCSHDKCDKLATFGFTNSDKAQFCTDHKQIGMVDIKHKKCSYPECMTRVRYGIPGLPMSTCAKHKTEGMCRYSLSRCEADDCKEKAFYGIDYPLHCEEHHEKLERNLCLRVCKNCSHLEICDSEGLCFEYCINSDIFKRSRRQKETRVQNLLKREIQEQPHSCDKIIDSSCNKKRPDILYDCKTHFLIIEIDEHQHSSYQAQCETTRMKEICQAIGMPTIFIRYNPDSYTDSQSHKSKISKAKREQILIEWVRHCIKSSPKSPEEFLRVVYLFYDGFEPTKSSLDVLQMI